MSADRTEHRPGGVPYRRVGRKARTDCTGVVHWQASLFATVVVALGAPIGIAAGRVVYRTFVARIGAVDTVTLPFGFHALTLVGLVALANEMAAPSGHRARQHPAGLADEWPPATRR